MNDSAGATLALDLDWLTAAQYDVPYVNATMSKLGLIEAFRSWMRTTGG